MKNGNCDAILGEIQDAVRVCNERICPGQGGQRRPPHEKVALNNDRAQKRRGGESAKHGQRLCGKREHLGHRDWTESTVAGVE